MLHFRADRTFVLPTEPGAQPVMEPQPHTSTQTALKYARSVPDPQALPENFLSVVVPARNEAPNLTQLVQEIIGALRLLTRTFSKASAKHLSGFEVIIVDDGSADETPLLLQNLARKYPELRSVRLAVPAGQSAATLVGFRCACGSWVATLDADLQNVPADLVMLWNALPGYDAALGYRVIRADSWLKRLISWLANRTRNLLLGQAIRDTGCSVRIFPRKIALQLPGFDGVHRFLGPLLLRERCRIIQLPVHHRPRSYGRSHYTVWNRSLRVIIDLLGVAWLLWRPVTQIPDGMEQLKFEHASEEWDRRQLSAHTRSWQEAC